MVVTSTINKKNEELLSFMKEVVLVYNVNIFMMPFKLIAIITFFLYKGLYFCICCSQEYGGAVSVLSAVQQSQIAQPESVPRRHS